MTADEGLRLAWLGNAICFLGSGFAKGAQNKAGSDFATAEEFRVRLATAAGGPLDGNLGDAAEAYRTKFGEYALVEEVVNQFSASTVADQHQIVASLPWRRVYTTNYDDVFENAAKNTKVNVIPVTLKLDPFAARDDGLQCVHLNGFVEGLTPEDIDTTLKLTDTSYVTSSIAQSPWAITFRNDLRLADVVFYFGYSLFDLDIKRILFDSPELRRKSFFILGEHPSPLTKQRVDRYGDLLETTVAGFSRRLTDAKPTVHEPRTPKFEALAQIEPASTSVAPRDQDVFDLFELGNARRDLVHHSLAEGGRYYLERTLTSRVLDLFGSGTPAVVLTSSLGNGKTLLLEGLAYRAVERGYKVFITHEFGPKAAIEFERVAKLDEPAVLLVDDYPSWLRELRSYGLTRKASSRLVLTARDISHDVLFEKLESELGLVSIPELRVDKLGEPEVEWIVSTLTAFGLWGDLAGASLLEKTQIVKTSLESEMRSVLLRLLRSSDIGNRLRSIIEGPKGKCPFLHVVASVFILAVLKAGNPRIEMIGDIWGPDVVSSSAFRNDNAIRTLLDFDRWTIRARSAVVAEFFLQEILGQDVVPILIAVIRTFAAGSRGNLGVYRHAFEELVRFATLQHILPVKGRLEAAIRFYEGVKDLPQANRHPLFWFQFGIACLAESDLSRARKYFTTAYSLAERTGFDTFQIDNHYARLLLVESSQMKVTAAEGMENFREARNIINRQLQRERLAYPFRVAQGYQDFIDRMGVKLDANQLSEVVKAVDFVEERLESVSGALRNSRHVRECAHTMKYVRQRCDDLTRNRGD